MIDQISIRNFRGFASQHISGLKRVNVIVGKNASGKSAFLEAIFMASGASGPNVTFSFRAWRLLGNIIQITADANSYQALWADLFHWFDQDKTISIEVIGTAGDSRAMRILYSDTGSQVLPFGKQPVGPSNMPQIIFEWKLGNEPPIIVKPKLTGKGLEVEGASIEHIPAIMFAPHTAETAEENAKRFSDLSKAGKVEPIVNALRAEYPFLDTLSIEYGAASPAVFASLKHNQRKMPVALISDGINKLLSLLLGMATYPKGSILIDQIEDGFYYSSMPSIWKTLYRFAVQYDCQIFATSHNIEYMRAMREVMHGNEDDFALLHAQRDNGTCSIRTTQGRFFEATLEQGFEVR
jgi:hypothetical protein